MRLVLNEKYFQEFKNILSIYGYKEFTSLQDRAFKLILKGYNVLIIAPTGYGKTEAALFPIFFSLFEDIRREKCVEGIKALYITPLRALNRDIFRRMEKLAGDLNLKMKIRHGDTSQHERRKISLDPPHILITTPETLQFLLVGKRIRKALRNVKWVIIDELHEMLESKRGLQLALSLERLKKITGKNYQRIALSATIGSPQKAAKFISGSSKVEILELSENKEYNITVLYPKPSKEDEELASDINIYPEVVARLRTIRKLIDYHKGVLIFTNTRDTAELLSNRLKLIYGVDIYVHHGSLSKEERIEVENRFKKGEIRAVIATSSLELGIDIGHVDFVVQYMSPRQVSRLIQRVGRSGHFMDKVSKGVIIAFDLDDLLESLVIARRAMNNDIEETSFEEEALDVLAHQIVGLVIEYGSISISEAYSIVRGAYPYRNLSVKRFKELITFMDKIKLVKVIGGNIRMGKRGLEYYFENASTIPDVPAYKVIDMVERRSIGKLDADFVASSLFEGGTFILGGKAWKVIQVNPERNEVYVRNSKIDIGEPPIWAGEDLPVPFKVAREVGSLRRRIAQLIIKNDDLEKLAKQYFIETEKIDDLINYIKDQIERTGVVPSDNVVLIEFSDTHMVVNTCIGSKGNETLGMIISFLLNIMYGISAMYRADPYRIAIKASSNLTKEIISNVLSSLEEGLNRIDDIIRKTNIYKLKLIQVARRFGVIEKGAERKISSSIIKALYGTPVDIEAVKETIFTKLDLEAVRWLIKNISKGKIKVIYRNLASEEFSPISSSIYNRYAKLGVLQEIPPISVIINVIKKRLENTKIRLLCLHCGVWYMDYKVKNVPSDVKCPRCGSRALAITTPLDEDSLKIVRKWKKGAKITPEEKKKIKQLQQTAILFMSYGRKALIAIAGRGIGPSTATKVLRSSIDEKELITNILKAENMYAKTRQYWD